MECSVCGRELGGATTCGVCGIAVEAPRGLRAVFAEQRAMQPRTVAPVAVDAVPVDRPSRLRGTVVAIRAPSEMPAGINGWKVAMLALVVLSLAPLVLAWWAMCLGLRLALGMLGASSGSGRGGGAWPSVLWWIDRSPRTIPVQTVTVRVGSRLRYVRVEGALRAGAIADNADVSFEGVDRDGTLVARRGWDHTHDAAIGIPRNPWRVGFFAFSLALGALIAAALQSGAVGP
jgi:hypothetical protein